MPSEPAEPVQVEYTPEFKRNLRALARKYRHIRSDVSDVIDQLRTGNVIGDQVPRDACAPYSRCGCGTGYSERKTFWLSPDLPPQNTYKHHSCDDLFQVGSGRHLGGADSAYSDPGLMSTSTNSANLRDDKQNSICIPALRPLAHPRHQIYLRPAPHLSALT